MYLYELFDVISFDLDVINIVLKDFNMKETLEDKNFYTVKEIPKEWAYYLVRKVFAADESFLVIILQEYKCPTCKYDYFDIETTNVPCAGCKIHGFFKWVEDNEYNG